MAFRRPKKPIRPRVVMLAGGDDDDDEEDEENNAMQVDQDLPQPPPAPPSSSKGGNNGHHHSHHHRKSKKDAKEDKKPSALLSFDHDDLDEGEEGGEVFQVKKSSVSRRLMKQRDKEKKMGSSSSKVTVIKKEKEETTTVLQVKVKKELEPPPPPPKETSFIRVLNGREAEAIHMESEDEEEDEEVVIKFNTNRRVVGGGQIQDAVRRALEQGQIPDANLIHEARKRKQMAREMGGAADFVPVNDNTVKYKKETGRLIREDDEGELSEEEERLDFSSATNAAKIDREKRIEDFNKAREEEEDLVGGGGDSDDGELDEWESQQIRKGVSHLKMQSVVKEMYHQSQSHVGFGLSTTGTEEPGFSFYPVPHHHHQGQEPKKKGKTQAFLEQTQKIASIEEVVNGSQKITPELVLRQMSNRLDRLKLSRESNAGELGRVEADLTLALKELEEATGVKSDLNSRFILYQNLRGYVTDLVDCLRCKVPELEALEERMIALLKARRDKFSERRRQDVRDQMEEVAATINIMGGTPGVLKPNPERTRRAAEREGRRTRRRRLREKEMGDGHKAHKDGLSSDDEEPDLDFKAYYAARENLVGELRTVFEDVHEDFGTVSGILTRFEEWKENDFDSYKESYAYMCLPKCVSPLIRLHLLSWDPLREGCDFQKTSWMRSLLSFGYRKGETAEGLLTDPDSRLIPSVVEKVLLPWLSRFIEARWDPMSGSQTRGLVNTLTRIIEEYSVSPSSKPMHSLMEVVINRLKDALDNDVYVPIYAKAALANSFTPPSVFLSRQFWSSIKLLDNMSKWQGLLADRPLQALAFDGLLTRYTLLGIRMGNDLSESVERARGVVNVLPRAWLPRGDSSSSSSSSDAVPNVPNGMLQLSRCLVSLCQSCDCSVATNRLAIPEVASVLRTIGSKDEADIILGKYS